MRPDLEDFDDIHQQPQEQARSRAMSWLVLGVAVTGFTALAYYAYQSGTRSMHDSNIFIVNAEPGNIKEAPADPGGAEFPNKEKTIYDAIAGDDDAPKVEKLLPEAETPVIPESQPVAVKKSEPPATTFVHKEEKTPPAPATPEIAEAPAKMVDDLVSDAEIGIAAAPVAKAVPAPVAAVPVASPKVEVAPEVANAEPAKTEVKAPEAAPVVAEKPKAPTKPKAATGAYKIQLGAYASNQEALANWKRISKKHSALVSGSPVVVKASLDSGTFYRLRASGYATAAAAKSACAKLSAAGQACFYVGK